MKKSRKAGRAVYSLPTMGSCSCHPWHSVVSFFRKSLGLSSQPHLARQRHCKNRLQRLHRRNLRRRNTSSSMRRTTKTWLWIHSIHCSCKILLYYLHLNINQLLQRILKQVGREAGLTVRCPRLRLFNILTQPLIRHVNLDKRKLLFLNCLYRHHPPSRSSSVAPIAPTEFYSDIAKAYGRVHA